MGEYEAEYNDKVYPGKTKSSRDKERKSHWTNIFNAKTPGVVSATTATSTIAKAEHVVKDRKVLIAAYEDPDTTPP